eukprot:GHVS01086269.1.p1 GENE.GHVS01086269.1~~GHVS01086269.1.p1  ORF type:complete len:251 (+),score=31.12 GHVS01086269.1:159-911(+)
MEEEGRKILAVVLAGGEGDDLGQLCRTTDKPLVPLANRPLLWYVLKLLEIQRFQDVTVQCRHGRSSDVRSLCASLFPAVTVREASLNASGGQALWEALTQDTKSEHEHVLVLSCDLVGHVDLQALSKFHSASGAACTSLLFRSQQINSTKSRFTTAGRAIAGEQCPSRSVCVCSVQLSTTSTWLGLEEEGRVQLVDITHALGHERDVHAVVCVVLVVLCAMYVCICLCVCWYFVARVYVHMFVIPTLCEM